MMQKFPCTGNSIIDVIFHLLLLNVQFRFLQRPGDLVWVNSGCIHWMQAQGWSNNIEWNVGPMNFKQYSMALERYEWDKLQFHKSEVPMVYLSWNIAKNVRVADSKLYESLKSTLMRCLRQVTLTAEFVKSKGCELKFHSRSRTEPAHFCGWCEIEVFGVLFIREQEEKHVVHCLDCARKHNKDLKGFVCLEEYHLKELRDVYNNFKLANQNQINYPKPMSAQYQSQPQSITSSQSGASTSTKSPSSSSSSSLGAAQSLIGSGMSASSLQNMMNQMAGMTPQQQLVIQQAIAAQQQALLNQS